MVVELTPEAKARIASISKWLEGERGAISANAHVPGLGRVTIFLNGIYHVVSEADIEHFSCSGCGCPEFHREPVQRSL